MGDFGVVSPQTKTSSPQIEIWNTINQWSFFQFLNFNPHCTNVKPLYWRLSGPLIETFMRAFRVASNSRFRCLVLTRHRVENLCSGQVVANGMNSTLLQYWWSTIIAQHGLSYCHITFMVEVAKPIILANAVHQALQGSYFSIRYLFFQNPVRCTRSATALNLSQMRCWWIASNSELRAFFPGYWLFGVNQSWDDCLGGMSMEAWQAPKCKYYHSFLGRWQLPMLLAEHAE